MPPEASREPEVSLDAAVHGIAIMCEGPSNGSSHPEVYLAKLNNLKRRHGKTTQFISEAGHISWNIDCPLCKQRCCINQDTAIELASFIKQHPELLHPFSRYGRKGNNAIHLWLLNRLITQMPKVRKTIGA